MATSGTVTYRINRDALITAALRLCAAIDPENTAGPTATQISGGSEALNLMIKGWEAEGLQLWERKYGVIFPQQGQEVYALGTPGPGGDHACLSTPLGTGFINTTLASDAASGATSLTLTATSNSGTVYATVGVPAITMAIGDHIGVELDDGTMFWTTISTVNTSTNVVTIPTGLTSAASAGGTVNTYTTKLIRPLRILDGFVRQTGTNDIPLMIIPRENYNRFGQKGSQGTSIQLYYDPQENTGHVYVYPTTQDVGQLIFIEFQKPIDDMTSSTDDYDMPQEWGEALKFNLALRLAPEYTVPKDKYAQIKELAMATYMRLDGWDQEAASVYIQPSQWAYNPMMGSGK